MYGWEGRQSTIASAAAALSTAFSESKSCRFPRGHMRQSAGLLVGNGPKSCRLADSHLGQSTPFSLSSPSPQFMIDISPGSLGSLACPCAFKMAALSSQAVRNRCDGSRRDEIAVGMGGKAGSAAAAEEAPFLLFFSLTDALWATEGNIMVVGAAAAAAGAVVVEAAAPSPTAGNTLSVGNSKASNAIVFSSSLRNLGCSSASGASSF